MNTAIQARTMPKANATGMTDDERVTFNQWFTAGAKTSD
jgi:uncharacterized membrane protein